jgi:hypothetical protein
VAVEEQQQRERREREAAARRKEKHHDGSANASTEVKQKLQVWIEPFDCPLRHETDV